VVNLHRIRSLSSREAGRIEAILETGERLMVSRRYAPLLRERLGL
jgi:DNA-binding LytR/AlgR family response regulator